MRSCCWCGRLRDVEVLSTSGAEGGVKFDLHTLLQAVEGLCVVRITFNSYVVVLEPELGEGPAAARVEAARRARGAGSRTRRRRSRRVPRALGVYGEAGDTRPATFFW